MKKITNHPFWQPLHAALPPEIASWLRYDQSMTKKIKSLNPDTFSFTLQNQHKVLPTCFEENYLPSKPHEIVIQRNTVMAHDGLRCLFGRTLGNAALFETDTMLQNLGARPIGQLLFTTPHITRTEVLYCQLNSRHELYLAATNTLATAPSTLWARCTRYRAWEYSLLIYEVFFPVLFTWKIQHAVPA